MIDVFKKKKETRSADFKFKLDSDYNVATMPDVAASNFSRVRGYGNLVELILKEVNTSASVLFNTLFVAILNGDIIIERSFNNSKLLMVKGTEDPSKVLLTLKDKDGRIINPTPMDDNLIDMFWGMHYK